MNKRRFLHLSAKLVFVGATFGIALAFVELAANLFGSSLTNLTYSAGRILELSAALLTYVLAVLAWEILTELKSKGS